MFPYIIRTSDFKSEEGLKALKETFNIDSIEELNDIFYIVVNEDKMKLPIGGRKDGLVNVSSSIPLKFVTNPIRIEDNEQLFELLDLNRGSPSKYFFILNQNNQRNPGKEMTVHQKLFRKFFYENSSFMDSETVFAEILDPKVAKNAFGIIDQNEIVAVQNSNSFSKFNDTKFKSQKFFNLNLEILRLKPLDL